MATVLRLGGRVGRWWEAGQPCSGIVASREGHIGGGGGVQWAPTSAVGLGKIGMLGGGGGMLGRGGRVPMFELPLNSRDDTPRGALQAFPRLEIRVRDLVRWDHPAHNYKGRSAKLGRADVAGNHLGKV